MVTLLTWWCLIDCTMYLTLIFLTCCAILVDLQIFIHIYTFSHYISHLNIYILFFLTKCTHVVLTAFEVTIVVPLGNIHFLY